MSTSQGGQGEGKVTVIPDAATLVHNFVINGGAKDGAKLAIQIQPEGAEAIYVNADMLSASKKANNKRKNNAKASRR